MCVYSLNYPAWNARESYYIVFVACVALPHLSTLIHKLQALRKKNTEHKIFDIILSVSLSETFFFFILRRNEQDVVCAHRSWCKVPVILVRFSWDVNFIARFSKTLNISNSMKIRREEAGLFHADGQTQSRTDGQTDRHNEADSRFSQWLRTRLKRVYEVTRLYFFINFKFGPVYKYVKKILFCTVTKHN